MNYDQFDNSKQITWNRRPESNLNGIDIEVDLRDDDINTKKSVRLSNRNNRFEQKLRYTNLVTSNINQISQNSYEYSLATALVYAGGQLALSKPIKDSFAIVATPEEIEKYSLIVDGRGETYSAKSDFFGPAVVSELQSYNHRVLNIDIPNLPLGYEAGKGYVNVKPTYHSGVYIPYGSKAKVLLRGVIVDDKNAPRSLKAGNIKSITQSQSSDKVFFTNREGMFMIEGIDAGDYQISLFGHNDQLITITIPENTEGVYDAKPILIR